MSVQTRWLGRVAYTDAHALMKQTLAERIAGDIPDTLLLCEHDPVYTLGRSRGAAGNVLDPRGVPIINVERGGDVTFHGPGQLIGYPIFGLPEHRHDLHGYLRGLEESIITLLSSHGITGQRDDRNTGVWVEGRKIAAIGIAARRWVTWHGFALNRDVDLGYFQRINPCGMDSTLVTRMVDHTSAPPPLSVLAEEASKAITDWWMTWTSPG
ncbi:MAG: lipoyl(octanoyl) transferase LipB [Myxococcota bacterium]|nr:lipoyl(octanoyl) transferase LipB [Myxococcota bacterium]